MRILTPNQQKCLDIIIKQGNNYLSYSHLQNGIENYFLGDKALMSYAQERGLFGLFGLRPVTYVLGDPVCHPDNLKEIVDSFRDDIDPNPIFLQISENNPTFYTKQLGFYVNILGVNSFIDLTKYRDFVHFIAGPKRLSIRQKYRGGEKAGLRFAEINVDEQKVAEFHDITDSWIRTKKIKNREIAFLSPPPIFDDEPYVRKFAAFSKDDKMMGYVFFTPNFVRGKIIGYAPNILRSRVDAPTSTNDFITLKAIELFMQEGVQRVDLGISPLHNCDDPEPYDPSWLTKGFFRLLYHGANSFYSFQNLAFHKRLYQPEEEYVYIATPRDISIRKLLAGFRLNKLI